MLLNFKGKKVKLEKGDLLQLRNGKTVSFDSAVTIEPTSSKQDTPMIFVRAEKEPEPYPIPIEEIENILKLVQQSLSLFERIVRAIKRLFGGS